MCKYPDTKLIITRLMLEGGYQTASGELDRKRFCAHAGCTPQLLNNYLRGETSISTARLVGIINKLGLKSFNIV